jgi:hypothetical protein
VAVITQQGSEIFTVTEYHPDEDDKTYKIYSNELNTHVTIIVSRYKLGMWSKRQRIEENPQSEYDGRPVNIKNG